jgi:hypothetical protein
LISRDGAAAARMAHNHEVPGSSPGPATKCTTTSVIATEIFVMYNLTVFGILMLRICDVLPAFGGVAHVWDAAVVFEHTGHMQ